MMLHLKKKFKGIIHEKSLFFVARYGKHSIKKTNKICKKLDTDHYDIFQFNILH